MSVQFAELYIKKNSESGSKLTLFYRKNYETISSRMYIKFYVVTDKNAAAVKKRGIARTPALKSNGKIIIGVNNILKCWSTVPVRRKQVSADELTRGFQNQILDLGDEDAPDIDMRRIEAKMSKMRANKPHIRDTFVPTKQNVSVGNTDDAFLEAAGVDNISHLPMESFDGDKMLEDYMNIEGRRTETFSQYNF